MSALPFDPALEFPVGEHTAGENLARAIDAGRVLLREDGRLELPPKEGAPTLRPWWSIASDTPMAGPCKLMAEFAFPLLYDRSRVPFGCRDCFKVRIAARTLKELVLLRDAAPAIPCQSKWGPEVDLPYTTDLYAGYFYTVGLDHAREIHARLRKLLAGHPELDADLPIVIKRGCSDYEFRCGPSDQWTFDPAQPVLEAWLAERAVVRKRKETAIEAKMREKVLFMEWLAVAHRIGDESYLEFTSGKPLYPPPVTYEG